MKNRFINLALLLCAMLFGVSVAQASDKYVADRPSASSSKKVVVAYINSWSAFSADPFAMTHINFAFGGVNAARNGVDFGTGSNFEKAKGLKSQNPNLKLMLSIGGWGAADTFAQMASNETNRKAFAKDCKRVCEQFGFDGIDIDWEYPTGNAQANNFTDLMKDIRAEIGPDKYLTLATANGGGDIHFRDILEYIDFVNIMGYDLGGGNAHNAPLYYSSLCTNWGTVSDGVKAHLNKGVPADKLVLGMPFYGRGNGKYQNGGDNSVNYKDISASDLQYRKWDDVAKVPYLETPGGTLFYDDVESIGIKCDYLNSLGLRGGMYWDLNGDNGTHDLQHVLKEKILDAYPDNPDEPDTDNRIRLGNVAPKGVAWCSTQHDELNSSADGRDCGPASYVNDENDGTRWQSGWMGIDNPADGWVHPADPGCENNAPQWVAVDLGKEYNIIGIDVQWQEAYAKDYMLQIAPEDNVSESAVTADRDWVTVETYKNWDGTPILTKLYDFDDIIKARYVRVYCTERGFFGYGYSIVELMIYGADDLSGIKDLTDVRSDVFDLYNMQGMLVRHNVNPIALSGVAAPGLYIVKNGTRTRKVLIP